jgi:meso-butanediol dehydrogenase/(S,S)-butanediol dehydrogenase/diacetyl reductase
MKQFEGKIALVTGGGTGIGGAISRELINQGADVVVAQRSECTIENVTHISVDLSDSDQCGKLVERVIADYRRLDVLVNNAGVMLESTVEEMSLEDWNKTISVNLTAPFLLTKYALPWLKKSGGNIVNIGSIEGIGSNPGHSAYSASKAGLHGLTRAIAVDHGNHGVRCNAVAPGWIDTDLNRDFVASMPRPT